MAWNFPAAPTVGQVFTPQAGISYAWSGTHWDKTASPLNPTMPAGVMAPFAGSVAPPGTLLCDGKTFVRADYPLLFAAIGTTYGAGNGTTTANLPDLRGRSIFGKDDMGGTAANRITNAGVGNSGINGATLGATGGFDRYTLAEIHIPSHYHSGSGTSSQVSADHTHSGTTAGFNTNHQHHVSGSTDAGTGNHEHTYDRTDSVDPKWIQGGASSGRNAVAHATYGGGAHQHTINFWAGFANVDHVHGFSTGGISANHTHTYSFDTDWKGGSEAHPIMPPAVIANYIIFTGA